MHPFALLLVAALLMLLLLTTHARGECQGAVTETCDISNGEMALVDQVFCPGSDSSGLELAGTGCSSLRYCCQTVTNFGRVSAKNVLSVSGAAFYIESGTGAIVVAEGQQVKIEFFGSACVSRLSMSTGGAPSQGSARISRYFRQGVEPPVQTTDAPLSPSGSASDATIGECRMLALSVRAPNDAALRIESISLCLVGTSADACGVCNGDGSTCSEAAAASASAASMMQAASYDPNSCVTAPVEPTVYCHSRQEDACCTVFGYVNPNPCVVSQWPGPDNYVSPPQNPSSLDYYVGQPMSFEPGVVEAAWSISWNCTRHQQIHLKWQLNSNVVGDPEIAEKLDFVSTPTSNWPRYVSVHREFKLGCPTNMC